MEEVHKVDWNQTREVDVLAKLVRQGITENDVVLKFCKSTWEELHICLEETSFEHL